MLTWRSTSARNGVPCRDGQRHFLRSAARVSAQGAFRRDLLRRSAEGRREVTLRHPPRQAQSPTGGLPICRRLAELSDGFSGAEIEQAIVAASFEAECAASAAGHAGYRERAERYAAVVGGDGQQVAALRRWAASRTATGRLVVGQFEKNEQKPRPRHQDNKFHQGKPNVTLVVRFFC